MKRVLAALLLLSATGSATEQSPWIDHVLEPIIQVAGTYQHFQGYETKGNHCNQTENNALIDTGIFLALSADMAFEAEMRIKRTHTFPWTIDCFKQTGRFGFLDDSEGDCFSLAAGLTLSEVFTRGLNDPAVFHHGHFEAEAFLTVGQEWICYDTWIYRLWGVVAIGQADVGYPWLRSLLAADYNIADTHFFRMKLEGRKGCGGNRLHLLHFRGYGYINYYAIDTSVQYTYQTDCGVLFGLEALGRLAEYNAPKHLTQLTLTLNYPF